MPIFEELWEVKNKLPETMITAVLKKDVDAVARVIPSGTKVRIWMVSRFGDVGITDDLSTSASGYDARVGPAPSVVRNVRNPGNLEDYLSEVILHTKERQ